MAINFLNFCRTGSAIDVAFHVGAPRVGCAAGRIHIESLGGKGKLCSWWYSTALSTAFLTQQGKDFFFLLPWINSSTNT